MCGSDPESFYPRAYDLYDPLECGPLDRWQMPLNVFELNHGNTRWNNTWIVDWSMGIVHTSLLHTLAAHVWHFTKESWFCIELQIHEGMEVFEKLTGGDFVSESFRWEYDESLMRVPPFHDLGSSHSARVLKEHWLPGCLVLNSQSSCLLWCFMGGLFLASVVPLEGLPIWQCDGGCWRSQNLRTCMRSCTTCCCLERYSNLKLQSSIQEELLKEIQISIENVNLYII